MTLNWWRRDWHLYVGEMATKGSLESIRLRDSEMLKGIWKYVPSTRQWSSSGIRQWHVETSAAGFRIYLGTLLCRKREMLDQKLECFFSQHSWWCHRHSTFKEKKMIYIEITWWVRHISVFIVALNSLIRRIVPCWSKLLWYCLNLPWIIKYWMQSTFPSRVTIAWLLISDQHEFKKQRPNKQIPGDRHV